MSANAQETAQLLYSFGALTGHQMIHHLWWLESEKRWNIFFSISIDHTLLGLKRSS
jgi:hypothetical protein